MGSPSVRLKVGVRPVMRLILVMYQVPESTASMPAVKSPVMKRPRTPAATRAGAFLLLQVEVAQAWEGEGEGRGEWLRGIGLMIFGMLWSS